MKRVFALGMNPTGLNCLQKFGGCHSVNQSVFLSRYTCGLSPFNFDWIRS